MAQTLVNLEKKQETIVKNLIQEGYYKTKSEVVRAGILELGKQYHIVGVQDDMVIKQIVDPQIVAKLRKISDEIKQGKRKTHDWEEVKKKYGWKDEDPK